MSKNILVISSSLRGGSNSDILADEFIRGAREAGNKVEKISLRGKKINFCIGCLACQQSGTCVLKDDMAFARYAAGRCNLLCVAGVFLRYVRAIENFFRPYQPAVSVGI